MKRRSGFVSNSSSSSFIVIDSGGQIEMEPHDGETLVVNRNLGETQFGWEFEKYSWFGDKLIFSYLQTQYAENDEWLEMLEDVVKEYTGCSDIEWGIDIDNEDKDWAYIDHQSSALEGENTEMFDNKNNLINFLFNTNSYIQGGNDNV